MPELPEVEGARRRLSPLIAGTTLERLEVLDPKLWRPAEGLGPESAAGRAVRALERRAKLLLFRLAGDLSLVLHLKVAGQLVYVRPDGGRLVGGHPYPLPDADLPDPSSRFRLDFRLDSRPAGPTSRPEGPASAAPDGTLYVNDQRRFAWLRLLPDAQLEPFLAGQRYGPDPLAPDFTPERLGERLRARRGRPVKAALLDQTCIAGIGNIYADESLHAARLHPLLRAGDLTPESVGRLHGAIREILEVAVPVGGALVRRGGRVVAEVDRERDFLHAHGKAGEECPECRAAERLTPEGEPPRIVREFLAGRGTYYCPVCQPAPADAPRGAT